MTAHVVQRGRDRVAAASILVVLLASAFFLGLVHALMHELRPASLASSIFASPRARGFGTNHLDADPASGAKRGSRRSTKLATPSLKSGAEKDSIISRSASASASASVRSRS